MQKQHAPRLGLISPNERQSGPWRSTWTCFKRTRSNSTSRSPQTARSTSRSCLLAPRMPQSRSRKPRLRRLRRRNQPRNSEPEEEASLESFVRIEAPAPAEVTAETSAQVAKPKAKAVAKRKSERMSDKQTLSCTVNKKWEWVLFRSKAPGKSEGLGCREWVMIQEATA